MAESLRRIKRVLYLHIVVFGDISNIAVFISLYQMLVYNINSPRPFPQTK